MKFRKLMNKSIQLLLACMIAELAVYPGSITVQAEDSVYGKPKTGSANTQEEIYTWIMIDSLEDLQKVMKSYPETYGGDGTVPIMLVADSGKERSVIYSPGGDGSYGKTEVSYTYDKLINIMGVNQAAVFSAHSRTSYNGMSSAPEDSITSLAENNWMFITRGLYGAFYLEYSPEEENLGRSDLVDPECLTHDYVLHTYKVEDGKYSASEYALSYELIKDRSEYQTIYDNIDLMNMSYTSMEGERNTAVVKDHWTISEVPGRFSNYFRIWNTYMPRSDGQQTMIGITQTRYKRVALLTYDTHCKDYEFCVQSTLEGTVYDYGGTVSQKKTDDNSLWYVENPEATNADPIDGIMDFRIYYGVPGLMKQIMAYVEEDKGALPDRDEKDEFLKITTATTISGDSRTIKAGETYAIPDYSAFLILNGKSLIIEKGATLIVGRNALLINNGLIKNEGQIIVQPGALVDYLDAHIESLLGLASPSSGSAEITPSWMAENLQAPIISGTGNLVVRKGGRIRTAYLLLEGDLHNSGAIMVTKAATRPAMVVTNNAQFLLGYDGPPNLFKYGSTGGWNSAAEYYGTSSTDEEKALYDKFSTFRQVGCKEEFSSGKSKIWINY